MSNKENGRVTNLAAAIKALPCKPPLSNNLSVRHAYMDGHQDAREAAAALARGVLRPLLVEQVEEVLARIEAEPSMQIKCALQDELGDAWATLSTSAAQQGPTGELQTIEQYRMQMAAITTASLGYWTEAEGISPEYDTAPLRDVAKLYAKYAELHSIVHGKPPAKEPA